MFRSILRFNLFYYLSKYYKMIALNIVEMFFFVSLAMTFILILLIVYHFKQRISLIEQKNDTIFEIINNLLQRVGDLNKYQCVLSNTISNGNFMKSNPISNPVSKCIPEVFTENVESLVKESNNIVLNEKITVSDDDDEDDDDEDDDDEDDDDEDDNEDDDDEDDNDDDDDEDDDEDSDDDDEDKIKNIKDIKELSNQAIKIVNIELKDINNDEIFIYDLETKNINLEDNMIQVEKIEVNMDNIENMEVNIENDNISLKENLKDIYNKMSVQELRKVVITKGLCSDSSKLKKNELLKMLE